METKKRIPIGISDYKMLIDENYYYIDKTDFIRQLVEKGSLITMLPRPRRFGKTLNLSMLRYFFERTEGNIYRHLFNGKKIEQWKDFDRYQGKYPVITLTLKDCKAETFEGALERIAEEVQQEYIRHKYLPDNPDMEKSYRSTFEIIRAGNPTQVQLESSLGLLTDLLTTHWGIPPLVLLDEYDTPIHTAFDKGYYDTMIGFMRNFMSKVFKDNTDIFRGVITGILRVSKESIFSGLNNIAVDTILDKKMCSAFGFTQEETDQMLDAYELSSHKEEVRQWYNGYLFGNQVIYNPWSVLNYTDSKGKLIPYWVNTGSDVLLRHLVANGPSVIRHGIEALIQGESVYSTINDKLAFPDLLANPVNIWSFMLFSGYLKASEPVLQNNNLIRLTLQVPNREISTVFYTIIQNWINNGPVKNDRLETMLQALDENNMPIFQRLLNDFVVNTLSYYDTSGRDPEKVYQAFLLGMLVSNGAYEISSNREAGLGRYDILMRPRDLSKRGIIMELKLFDPLYDESVEETLSSALRQIEDKQYTASLHAVGITNVLEMAITFDGKRVWIKTKEQPL